eukprot:m.231701 g.231701  ORF g.231701 m.231701 type:complete len:1644 (+) comp15223_c0_seq1:314-5245(+)
MADQGTPRTRRSAKRTSTESQPPSEQPQTQSQTADNDPLRRSARIQAKAAKAEASQPPARDVAASAASVSASASASASTSVSASVVASDCSPAAIAKLRRRNLQQKLKARRRKSPASASAAAAAATTSGTFRAPFPRASSLPPLPSLPQPTMDFDGDQDLLAMLARARETAGEGGDADMSRLLSLLRRSGSGGSGGGKYETMLSKLQSPDPSEISPALNELAQMLLMGNEDTLRGFSPEPFVKALETILAMDANPELPLTACRALTNMLEAFPQSARYIASCTPLLCDKLLHIEFIDLAEQSLTCIAKLAQVKPQAVLDAGALMALLSYIDFFPIMVQRDAMATVGRIAEHVRKSKFEKLVRGCLQPLCSIAQVGRDKQMVSHACYALNSIIDNVQGSISMLDAVAEAGFLQNAVELVTATPPVIGSRVLSALLASLATITKYSPTASIKLLEQGAITKFKSLVSARDQSDEDAELSMLHADSAPGDASAVVDMDTSMDASTPTASAGTSLTEDQLALLLQIVCSVLPQLSPKIAFRMALGEYGSSESTTSHWFWCDDADHWHPFAPEHNRQIEASEGRAVMLSIRGHRYLIDTANQHQINTGTGKVRNIKREMRVVRPASRQPPSKEDPRRAFFESHPDNLQVLFEWVVTSLVNLYLSSGSRQLRVYFVDTLLRLFDLASPALLLQCLGDVPISNYLVQMLHSEEKLVVVGALSACKLLLDKIPDQITAHFYRKGVAFRLQQLKAEGVKARKQDSEIESEIESEGGLAAPAVTSSSSKQAPDSISAEFLATVASDVAQAHQAATSEDIHSNLAELKVVLDSLCADLMAAVDGNNCDALKVQFAALLQRLQIPDGITPFELVEHGICTQLARAVRAPSLLPVLAEKESESVEGYNKLLESLHEALQMLETLPVTVHQSPSRSRAAASISGNLKLILSRAEDEATLKEFGNHSVMIDPLAPIRAIEDFLWPKVRMPLPDEDGDDGEDDDGGSDDESERRGRRQHTVDTIQVPDETEGFWASLPEPKSSGRNLTISLNGHALPPNMSITEAVESFASGPQNSAVVEDDEDEDRGMPPGLAALMRSASGSTAYKIVYQRTPKRSRQLSVRSVAEGATLSQTLSVEFEDGQLHDTHFEPLRDILQVLRAAFLVNEYGRSLLGASAPAHGDEGRVLSNNVFVNSRIGAKVIREVANVRFLSGSNRDTWVTQLVAACPFLLSFDHRQQYLRYTAFGSARALQYYRTHVAQEEEHSSAGQVNLSKSKVRVSRDKLLPSVAKVMTLYGPRRTMLEAEFLGEEGTGLGPTLELYALASREFQRRQLNMWRAASDEMEYVENKWGLFPRPFNDTPNDVLVKFRTLGLLIAKAIQDERILDIVLCPVMLEWFLGRRPSSLDRLKDIDPELWKQMTELQAVATMATNIKADDALSDEERAKKLGEVRLNDCAIEDLCLEFSLPGYPDVALAGMDPSTPVTLDNLQQFIDGVVDVTLNSGIEDSIEALLEGFDAIFPARELSIFTVDEIQLCISGSANEPWDLEMLKHAIKADHGFTADSQTFVWLLEVLASLDEKERRAFVEFLTGSPNLPVGGLAKLRPQTTVVRKHADDPAKVLPSVMTCQNYLKLPNYPTIDVLRVQLMKAITDGRGSFDLS